jgi:hypothetical protein
LFHANSPIVSRASLKAESAAFELLQQLAVGGEVFAVFIEVLAEADPA